MKNYLLCLLLLTSFMALSHKNILEADLADKIKTIDAQIQQHYPKEGAGVAVLVLKGDDVLYKKAHGQAVIEFQLPMRADTPFNVGSITKQFTAVSILMLQEAGKLNLTDNINRYIPEYKQSNKNNITIKNLLTHTAGVPNYDGKNGYTHHGTDGDSFDFLLNAFNDLPLEFTPGTDVNYSNSGYILLGRIIEKVSNLSYIDFVKQHIFKKLQMVDSRFYDYYDIVPGLSKGYEINDKPPFNIIHGKAVKPSYLGDGGIVSTLDDLTKWYKALRKNTLISQDSQKLAFSSFTLSDGRDSKMALGWKAAKLGKFDTIEHGGNNHNFENYVMLIPEEELIIMVFSNLNKSYPGELAEKLASTLLDLPQAQKKPIMLTNKQLTQFVGTYQYADGDKRSINKIGNKLYSVRNNGEKSRIIPFSSNKFYFEAAPVYWLRFETDKKTGKNIMYSESRVTPYIMAKQVL